MPHPFPLCVDWFIKFSQGDVVSAILMLAVEILIPLIQTTTKLYIFYKLYYEKVLPYRSINASQYISLSISEIYDNAILYSARK